MVNRVILIGNVGKDPEVRYLESGKVVAKFSLATNESYKDKSGEWQSQTEWHNLVVWGAQAERAESIVKKGVQLYVEGKMTYQSYEDKDGIKRTLAQVRVNYFRITGKKEGISHESPSPNENTGTTGSGYQSGQAVTTNSQVPVDAADDDLPF